MNNTKNLKNSYKEEELCKKRWLILAVLVTQPFMACIDSSIVNVALPVIRENLSINMSTSEWIVTSYLIVISAFILIFGRLGDMKSKSKVFLNGIIVFTFGSFLCGISPNIFILVISRAIQAIGAAMLMSTNQGIITDVFPSNERGKALGISGSFVALGSILGPALGGFIITYLSWHFIFLINIPIGIIAYLFGRKYLPIKSVNSKETMDKKGACLFSLATILLFASILLSQSLSFSNPYIIIGLIASVIILSLFIFIENKEKNPMLDISLFKNPSLSINLICAFISFAAISTINIIQPFYLTDVLKYSSKEISFIMLFYPMILFFVAPLSGSLSDKIGSKKLTLIGLSLSGIIILCMAFLNENSSMLHIIILSSALGLANGMFQSPNTSLIMSSVPKNKLGIAGGTNALVRNLGLAFGISISTSILYSKMSSLAGYKVLESIPGKEYIFVYGMKSVYILTAISCFFAFAISLINKLKNTKN